MIIAVFGYGLMVGALAALAAWLVERVHIAFGRPRKHVWIGGIIAALLVPALVIWLREPGDGVASMLAMAVHTQVQGAAPATAMLLPAASPGGEASRGSLNAWLAALWALTTAVLLGVYAFSAWRLGRRARTWRPARVGADLVAIAPDIGPAVFGWLRSRVVFPRWLIDAPEGVQRLALAHEREHLVARDPQVLSVVILLGALLPWNLPLLWMLRRLRFAMEVDCDARVIRRGADPNEYGLALLYVSERQSRAPITAIALIERKSQLERRINFMFSTPRKHRALIAGLCLALAASCLYAAAQVQAPKLTTDKVILKPPPGGPNSPGFRLGQRFEILLRDRYPELLQGQFTDTAVVVAALNEDMTIANSAQITSIPPDGKRLSSKDLFAPLGLTPEQVPFTGMMDLQLSSETQKKVVIVYTMINASEATYSSFFPDTRKLDRELFAQQFPEAKSGVEAGQDPWLLMDRNGVALRKGLEPVNPKWEETLKERFKGITTQEVTVTNLVDEEGEPLRDASGKQVDLHVVWLAPGSQLPAN